MDDFSFLTNHARVLMCLGRHSEARMRDVAGWLDITERAVQRIVADLESAGYLRRIRQGRRNRYEVSRELPLRHPAEGAGSVASLLGLSEAEVANTDRPRREIARNGSFID